jgi:hypothetical protein
VRFPRILRTSLVVMVLIAACGASDFAGDGGPSTTIALPVLDGAAAGCSSDAVITMGLYPDDTCTAGTETATVAVDTTASCVAWPGGGSISAAVCYADRVCLTHVTGDACDSGTPTAAAATATSCTPGPGGVWMKVLDGTGNCPAAPDGFVCEPTPLDAVDDEVCPLQ